MSESSTYEKRCGKCGETFEASTEENATLLKDFHYIEEHIEEEEDE